MRWKEGVSMLSWSEADVNRQGGGETISWEIPAVLPEHERCDVKHHLKPSRLFDADLIV